MKRRTALFALALASLIAPVGQAAAADKVMVILQENSGRIDVLPDDTAPEVRDAVFAAVDTIAETFEDVKSDLQGPTRYKKVIHLTDRNCTRAKLLETLIAETVAGHEIDLYVFGHGGPETLYLHDDAVLTGGVDGNIRSLLTEARARKGAKFSFNLRLVYMCNCYGSTVNDDWTAIGANTSIGSACINYMAEPMITLFINKFVLENKSAHTAAEESFNEASLWWLGAGLVTNYYSPPDADYGCRRGDNKFQTSRPLVAGDGNLRFAPTDLFGLRPNPMRSIGDVIGATADDTLTEGVYYIRSAAGSGKYLDMEYACRNDAFCKVQTYGLGNTTSNNKWRLKKVDGVIGGYTLQVEINDKYLDADMWSIGGNGTKVQVASRLPFGSVRTNQEWKFVKRSDGNYTIKNIFSGRYLDSFNACVNQNGCGVQLWDDYGHITRKWKLVRAD